jgi:hypothetical protein
VPETNSDRQFTVPIESIGVFTFSRRTLRDEVRIQAAYARLTEGAETPTNVLHNLATWISCIQVQLVEAPKGFDLDALDPFDDETYRKLSKIYEEVMASEARFRGGERGRGETTSADSEEHAGVLVSQKI